LAACLPSLAVLCTSLRPCRDLPWLRLHTPAGRLETVAASPVPILGGLGRPGVAGDV